MKEQFEIKITINYEADNVSLETESKIISNKNPSIYFSVLSEYLNRQVLSDLESKLKLADDIAELVRLCEESRINGSEE